MARRGRPVVLVAVVAALAPGLEAQADALSCLAPLGDAPSPYRTHPVVVEAVALSGPSDPRVGLDSPARMLVLRWIRGSGPRIVRTQTAIDAGVGPWSSHMPGFFSPHAGTVARLFATRDRRGVLKPNPCVFGDERPDPRSPLRTVTGSAVRASAGPFAWRAHAQRGPQGLHCVVIHPVGRHTGGGKECEVGRPFLAVHQEESADGDFDSTAVVVGGPGVRSVDLRTPDGPIALAPAAPGHPALAVLDGRVDPAEVRARLTMTDGGERWLQPIGFPTLFAMDPELDRGWSSAIDVTGNRTCVGARRLPPRHGPAQDDHVDVGDMPLCGDLRRVPYLLAIEAARPESDERGAIVAEPVRKVVVGVAGPDVTEIVLRDPYGERRLEPGRGGQFLAVLPGSIPTADIEVAVTLRQNRRPRNW